MTSAVGAWCAMVVEYAPDFPPVIEDCRVGELVDHGQVSPPFRHEIVFVIDTHGDVPSRAEVAAAVGVVVRVLGTGDLEGDGCLEFETHVDDLRIAVITSAPECGEAPSRIEWVPELGIGGVQCVDAARPCGALPRAPARGERLGVRGYHHRCAELPGRDPTPLAIDENGIETCRIIQRRALETEPGWRLDTAADLCGPEGNHVALVGTELEPGSRFEVRCVSIPASEGCE